MLSITQNEVIFLLGQEVSSSSVAFELCSVHSRWSLLRGGRAIPSNEESSGRIESPRAALQGMGTLLRVGTRAMHELIVAHLTEDTTSEELRLFLRSLHRSSLTARADVVLLFPSSPMPIAMANVIQEEEDSFQRLLADFTPDEAPEASTSTASTGLNPTQNFRDIYLGYRMHGPNEYKNIINAAMQTI